MAGVRAVACLSLLVGISLQVDVKSGKEAGKAGNFMEDEQWLSTISQYSRKIKHWNRFRDVSCVFSVITRVSLSYLVCSCWCLRCCCRRCRCLWRRRGFVGSGDFCAQFYWLSEVRTKHNISSLCIRNTFLSFFKGGATQDINLCLKCACVFRRVLEPYEMFDLFFSSSRCLIYW